MITIKVLYLAANPTDLGRLNLDEEIRSISEKIRAAEYRDSIELIPAWATRADDVIQLLNQHKPNIVHFSGHGDTSGDIVLMNEYGHPKAIEQAAVKMLFSALKDNIRIVVLNACYSQSQAEAITEVIDCAIGVSHTIGDRAATVFASSFYRAIGFGRSIQDAYEQGRSALLMEGLTETQTPILFTKAGIDPSQIQLLPTLSASRFPAVENAQRVIKQPTKRISKIEQVLYSVRALLYDLSEPSWIELVAEVEDKLSSIRNELIRASEGATSSERSGNYQRAINIYRSAIRRGFEEIIDDSTGAPIETTTLLQRAIEGYKSHTYNRAVRRYEEALNAISEGYPNTARQMITEAMQILDQAKEFDDESMNNLRYRLEELSTQIPHGEM